MTERVRPLRPVHRRRPKSARERRAELIVALSFLTTMGSGGALLVVYILGGLPTLEGFLLMLALGGLGLGIIVWSHDLIRVEAVIEERTPLAVDRAALADIRGALLDESGISRRTLLVRLMLGAFGALAAALTIPILSLGPAPGATLYQTGWRPGLRLVTPDGQLLTADMLPLGSVATAFPEGEVVDTNSQAVLIRVPPELLELPAERRDWAPEGFVAYSKLCTHAGCPVGLYLDERYELVCPCHQSIFAVLRGAVPIHGPAGRPLPQLPIALQPDGTFVARGDFPEPVGPSFWRMEI